MGGDMSAGERALERYRPPGTPEEVAEYLGVQVRTLEEWRRRSKGPAFARVGKFVRYRWVDVDRWLEKGGDAA